MARVADLIQYRYIGSGLAPQWVNQRDPTMASRTDVREEQRKLFAKRKKRK